MSNREAVIQVNRAFYSAFESLELDRMEQVWLKAPHITCIHPGWRRLEGWGPIMTSWERIFDSTFEMKFEIEDESVVLHDDLAIVVCLEVLTQRGYEGATTSEVLATNVFERVGDRWYMILHHGSPVAMAADDEPPLQ